MGDMGHSAESGTEREVLLSLRNVTKRFGNLKVVDGTDLDVYAGEFLTLLGPSGCGKTSTLRCITGSLSIDSGVIYLRGEDVTNRPTHLRRLGLVFQSFALFPHMTVAKNVAFPLRVRRWTKEAIAQRVGETLDLVQLGGLADRYPRELSGGQQQRVGLARAIVYRPDPVLFDEPLSNLDAKLRREMRYEIRRLRDELGFTAIYVTHDQEEALALSDRIAVMNEGVIHQIGHPEEVYAIPATLFVASFLGNPNCITCTIQELTSAGAIVRVGDSEFRSTLVGEGSPGDRAVLIIRPEDVQVGSLDSDAPMNEFEGRVTSAGFLGERRECSVRIHDEFDLRILMSADQRRISGDLVSIAIPVQECRVFVDSDGQSAA